MTFQLISRNGKIPSNGNETIYLKIDLWNDYSFVTMFYMYLHDKGGSLHDIGNLKIGFIGQVEEVSTYEKMSNSFEHLPEGFFSLGMDVDYYSKISKLSKKFRIKLLSSLNDMVHEPSIITIAENEAVFRTSLLRGVSRSVIKGQFVRVLAGSPPLTNFEFSYRLPPDKKTAGIDLDFTVEANSKPSTNIHALIGRNGVGKTTLLNAMIESITSCGKSSGSFFDEVSWSSQPIAEDYFSSLVSVSFSAFDPFTPPFEQSDPSKGTCYFYIGLKNMGSGKSSPLKGLDDLHLEFASSLSLCLSQNKRKERWEKAIEALESDENFAEMKLLELLQYTGDTLKQKSLKRIKRMSSGHTIVLLTITKLVARVEEKTLVLIDEPESHLHPPLLSAFIRSLSELLYDRNGVAIMATHSPVVLQEIPKTCAWKINRSRLEMKAIRPDEETFGENVGTLTREIFGLEVVKSGFHQLLIESIEKGDSYEDILAYYKEQLGYEAKGILKALVVHRDKSSH